MKTTLPTPHVNRRSALVGGAAALALTSTAVTSMTAFAQGKVDLSAELGEQVDMEAFKAAAKVEDQVLGNKDAPVTLVEYASMTCPHCARFHASILPKLKEKYVESGKAKFIFRDFPLDTLAAAGSMLARCADPSKYFALVDVLFEKQPIWVTRNPLPELQKIAKQTGMNKEEFEKCLGNQDLLDKITEGRTIANEKFKVRSTPTLFINGRMLTGRSTVENISRIIDELAKKSG